MASGSCGSTYGHCGTGGSSATKKWYMCLAMNAAVAGCSQMISTISSPSKLPVRPRNSFSPSSWSSSLNWKCHEMRPYGQIESRSARSAMYSVLPIVHPVNAREASLMSSSL